MNDAKKEKLKEKLALNTSYSLGMLLSVHPSA